MYNIFIIYIIYRYTVHWSTRRARQMNKICLLNTFSLGSDCVTYLHIVYLYIYMCVYTLPHEEIKCIPSAEHNIQRLHTKIRIVRTYNVYNNIRAQSFLPAKNVYTYNVFTTFCDCLQRTDTTVLQRTVSVTGRFAGHVHPCFFYFFLHHHDYDEVIQILIFFF